MADIHRPGARSVTAGCCSTHRLRRQGHRNSGMSDWRVRLVHVVRELSIRNASSEAPAFASCARSAEGPVSKEGPVDKGKGKQQSSSVLAVECRAAA